MDSAPIQKGEVLGTATYSINGENYTSNILAAETITEDIDNAISFDISYIIKIIISLIAIIILFRVIRKINIYRSSIRTSRYRYIKKTNKRRKGKGKHAL